MRGQTRDRSNRKTLPLVVVHFAELPDPRVERTRLHALTDIVTISILATMCGAEGWDDIALWGEAKKKWLCTFLELPNGIPSHDTFGRVFAALDPAAFRRCFVSWMEALQATTKGRLVAVDGKTLRGSFSSADAQGPIHMVSAFAQANSLVLGQLKTHEKSNEITAIPELLDLLSLEGSTVTIDAMGCQKEIAEKIRSKGANYLLALKGNHPKLMEEVTHLFSDSELEAQKQRGMRFFETETVDGGHGRVDTRKYISCATPAWLENITGWPDLRSLIMAERTRDTGTTVATERHYYLSSLPGTGVERHAQAIRGHWSIENNLHWCLDVQFHEDDSRVRKDNAPENLAIIRHIVLNLLRMEKTFKGSLRAKLKKAGWENTYLLKILGF